MKRRKLNHYRKLFNLNLLLIHHNYFIPFRSAFDVIFLRHFALFHCIFFLSLILDFGRKKSIDINRFNMKPKRIVSKSNISIKLKNFKRKKCENYLCSNFNSLILFDSIVSVNHYHNIN